jgi:hypothetical protein
MKMRQLQLQWPYQLVKKVILSVDILAVVQIQCKLHLSEMKSVTHGDRESLLSDEQKG